MCTHVGWTSAVRSRSAPDAIDHLDGLVIINGACSAWLDGAQPTIRALEHQARTPTSLSLVRASAMTGSEPTEVIRSNPRALVQQIVGTLKPEYRLKCVPWSRSPPSIPHAVLHPRHAAPIRDVRLWRGGGIACSTRAGTSQLSSGNQSAISRSADSTESEPWTRFC